MGDALGLVLVAALCVAFSPFRTSAVILVLLSAHGRTAGPLFLAGFVAALACVAALGLLVARSVDLGADDGRSTLTSLVFVVLGLIVLSVASWEWWNRPKAGTEPSPPFWMRSIDRLPPLAALGLGAGLAVFSFKNLGLIAAADVAIGAAEVATATAAVLLLVFIAVASVGVALPVVWRLRAGQSAVAKLTALKAWLTTNNALVMSLSMLLLGVTLLGKGLGGLLD
jgi:hypothetical protein